MDLLWKKYSTYWKNPIFVGASVGLVATMAKLSISIFIGNLIDIGVIEKDSKSLFSMIFSIFFYGIIGSILWLICKILFQKASYYVGKQIRLDLYDSVNKMSIQDIERIGCEKIGDLMSMDTQHIEYFMHHVIPRICYLIFSIIGSILIIMKMDASLGGIYFLVIFLLINFILKMITIPQGKKHENMRAICNSIAALSFPIFLCCCLILVERTTFTVGNAVTFFLYFYPIRKMAVTMERIYNEYEKWNLACQEIEMIFKISSRIKEGKIPFSTHSEINTPQILFQNVSFTMGEQTILNNLNLRISSGEHVGIVANETAGEVISYLLPRYYEPTTGSIELDGLDISKYTFQDLRSQIGIVQNKDRMYSGNFYENLIAGNDKAQMDDIEKALYAVGLLDVVSKMQRGLRTPIWKKEEHILEQHMFCTARMLLKEPSILILNHLWEGQIMQETLERIKEAYPYMTVIVIDSHLENLTECDQIIRGIL